MMSFVYGNSYASLPQQTAAVMQQPQQLQQYAMAYQQPSDAFLEDLSRQLASASPTIRRRHSRSSQYGSRTPGSAMRVVKPSSANNSPQSSAIMHARARMAAAAQEASCYNSPQQQIPQLAQYAPYPQQLALPQNYLPAGRYDVSAEAVAARPARPVSWHPSSTYLMPNQMAMQLPLSVAQFQTAVGQMPSAVEFEAFSSAQQYTMSPAACYSNQTSPSTAFSPYSGTFDTTTAGHYYSPNPWALSPSVNANGSLFDKLPSPVDCPALLSGEQQQQQQQMPVATVDNTQVYQQERLASADPSSISTSSSATVEWNDYAANGFDHSTAVPRTPPDNNCFSDATAAAIQPAQALELEQDNESDGEILVGMGLYDPPEKEVADATLERYRSSVVQMLGAAYAFPEPAGKGLKLEDAWELPENIDDDDEDDETNDDEENDEHDADGEAQ